MKKRIRFSFVALFLSVCLAFPLVSLAQDDIMTRMTLLSSELLEAQQQGADVTPYIPRIEALLRELQSSNELPPEMKGMIAEALEGMRSTVAVPTAPRAAMNGPGYYAFQQTGTPQDQDDNLQRHAGGSFIRIPGSGSGKSFSDLCREAGSGGSQALDCQYVLDWEGTRQSCNDSADDGSRIAWCGGGGQVAGNQPLSERRREANKAQADAFRKNARTITFSVRAALSECAVPGAFLNVTLHVEGAIVQESNGITQLLTGAWFGDQLPYVEGFGGLQVPAGDATSRSGHWDKWVCGAKSYVVTYDARRHSGGPPVDFIWSSMFNDFNLNRRNANTMKVRDGGVYSYKGADG